MLLSDCIKFWHYPVVIKQGIASWPALHGWNVNKRLSKSNEHLSLKFRMGKKKCDSIQWEIDCQYITARLDQFIEWLSCDSLNKSSCSESELLKLGHFIEYLPSQDWFAYADYKYICELNVPNDLVDQLKWEEFGYPSSSSGNGSTFWLGSVGSYTPCHYDTYGYNLVCQIQGVKQWTLFPPSQTNFLYPTRLPYEESSIYSQVNILNPDLTRYPRFAQATPYVVTLNPGDLLYVPRHWWHFVQSIDQSEAIGDKLTVSINLWVDQPELDHAERSKEALAKLVTFSLMKSLSVEQSEKDDEEEDSESETSAVSLPLWTRINPEEYQNYGNSRFSDELIDDIEISLSEHRRLANSSISECSNNHPPNQSKRLRVDKDSPAGYPNAAFVNSFAAGEIFHFNSKSSSDNECLINGVLSKRDIMIACTHPHVIQSIFDVLSV